MNLAGNNPSSASHAASFAGGAACWRLATTLPAPSLPETGPKSRNGTFEDLFVSRKRCGALSKGLLSTFVRCDSVFALMRRLIASLVLCLIAWGPLSPLAMATVGDSVPACCRLGGAHHCTMSKGGMAPVNDGHTSVHAVPDPCPYRSQRATPSANARLLPPLTVLHFSQSGDLHADLYKTIWDSRRPCAIPQRGPPPASAIAKS